jgi:hypothetical protein
MVGCASVRHLQTTPPAKTITLPEAVTMKSLGIETILPSGTYVAVMEDDDGYYYKPPEKLILNDMATQIADGGLYLKKETVVPTHYYYVGRRGLTSIRKLKVSPDFDLQP